MADKISATGPAVPPVEDRLRAENTLLRYWLLRSYAAYGREGWEEGPSQEETFDKVVSVLFNLGLQPGVHSMAAIYLNLPEWFSTDSDLAPANAMAEGQPSANPPQSQGRGADALRAAIEYQAGAFEKLQAATSERADLERGLVKAADAAFAAGRAVTYEHAAHALRGILAEVQPPAAPPAAEGAMRDALEAILACAGGGKGACNHCANVARRALATPPSADLGHGPQPPADPHPPADGAGETP